MLLQMAYTNTYRHNRPQPQNITIGVHVYREVPPFTIRACRKVLGILSGSFSNVHRGTPWVNISNVSKIHINQLFWDKIFLGNYFFILLLKLYSKFASSLVTKHFLSSSAIWQKTLLAGRNLNTWHFICSLLTACQLTLRCLCTLFCPARKHSDLF